MAEGLPAPSPVRPPFMRRYFLPSVDRFALSPRRRGFSLVEALLVIAIMVLMLVISLPAVLGIRGDRDITRAAYDLAGTLEQARSYAMASNTYVWVGFYEEDGSVPSRQPAQAGGGGRVIVSTVASRDGRRYSDAVISDSLPAAFGAGDASNPVALQQLSRLLRLENVRLVALNTPGENVPPRPEVPAAYQMGAAPGAGPQESLFERRGTPAQRNPTTFTYPLDAVAPQYTFTRIIEFSPGGEASKIGENVFSGPGPQDAMEIALQPASDGVIHPDYAGTRKAAAAIQIEGLTGQVRVFRP